MVLLFRHPPGNVRHLGVGACGRSNGQQGTRQSLSLETLRVVEPVHGVMCLLQLKHCGGNAIGLNADRLHADMLTCCMFLDDDVLHIVEGAV